MNFFYQSTLGLTVLLSSLAYAIDAPERLQENLVKLNPDFKITRISATPVTGIAEVELGGSEIIYASESGNHIFTGDLIDITDGRNDNLTEHRQQQIRRSTLATLDPASFITYRSTTEEASQVYVFTDISCNYCQNFHKQIEAINDAGITVHYLAFPRAGLNNATARLMERAWCAEDRQATLTTLKASGSAPSPQEPCRAPIASHFQIGTAMGVRGTPYILTPEGHILGGFLSTKELISALE
ncbi:MAG: DsbC family protein [Alcanivorax sp.]|nr:DsbC family protein [Alcanivorax sp.]